jgi:hypothetical protein
MATRIPTPTDILAAVAGFEALGAREKPIGTGTLTYHGGSTNDIARAVNSWPSKILPLLRRLVDEKKLRLVQRGPLKVYRINREVSDAK